MGRFTVLALLLGVTFSSAASAARLRPIAFEDLPKPVAVEMRTLYLSHGGDNVVALECGGGPGISPGIKSWYGCSHEGTLCYVNVTVNNKVASGDCTDCGGEGQPNCTPWDD